MTWISWMVNDWRLKLLALALAILMLGAVAFSQNPSTTRSLAVQLHYTSVGPDQTPLVIINPPSKVPITIQGLVDAVSNVTADNFTATVDATHAAPGAAVKLNISVTPTNTSVTVQPVAPIVVAIDKLAAIDVRVNVDAHGAPGWAVTNAVADPATVHFVGPASWEQGLKATVLGGTIINTHTGALNQPVLLSNSNGALSVTPCTTQPCSTLEPSSVAISIDAHTGTTSTTVALVASTPAQPPPPQYEITGVTVDPATVVITGDPTALGKIQRITLPAVDLSKATTTTKFSVNIPYPDGITPLNGITTATITYTIQRNPSVTPSP